MAATARRAETFECGPVLGFVGIRVPVPAQAHVAFPVPLAVFLTAAAVLKGKHLATEVVAGTGLFDSRLLVILAFESLFLLSLCLLARLYLKWTKDAALLPPCPVWQHAPLEGLPRRSLLRLLSETGG